MSGLVVYPEHMLRNLELTKGLYHSQAILLELTRRGLERKTAYEAVQRAAMKTWRGDLPLADNLRAEPEMTAVLSGEEIDRLCSLEPALCGTWTHVPAARIALRKRPVFPCGPSLTGNVARTILGACFRSSSIRRARVTVATRGIRTVFVIRLIP